MLVALLLFQIYLWVGFLLAKERNPGGWLSVYDVVTYSAAAVFGITMVIWTARTNRSLWIVSGWLFCTLSQLIVNFSFLYWNQGTGSGFTTRLSHLDALYFTMGTLSTAGTGKLAAVSQTTRGIQTLQYTLDIGLVLFAIAIFVPRLIHSRGDHGS